MDTVTVSIEQEMGRLNDLQIPVGRLERTLSTKAGPPQVVGTELHFVDCLGLCEE